MSDQGAILITAFEPSGDDHASAVIARLRRLRPDVPIYAWAGPKSGLAGATIVEPTGQDAVMGLPGLAKVREHLRINRRIKAWLTQHRVAVHVPVDSPAANFPICALTKARQIPVVHLVAPQLWAWGRWRLAKLRRSTDLVLCLLPFEQAWFAQRQVPARFIGHMLFDEPLDLGELDRQAAQFPDSSPRVALMPGSRPAEIDHNFPVQLAAAHRLRRDFPSLSVVVAAVSEAAAATIRRLVREHGAQAEWPSWLHVVVGQTDAVVRWCELAIVTSGTVTLQIAKQARPMVIIYRANRFKWMILGSLVDAAFFTLPNLVAGRRIVPELVPYFGQGDEIYHRARELIVSPALAEAQRRELAGIVQQFAGHDAAGAAADEILRVAGLAPQPLYPQPAASARSVP